MPFPLPGGLPDPGIEPMSTAMAGGFFTTETPCVCVFVCVFVSVCVFFNIPRVTDTVTYLSFSVCPFYTL